MRVRSIAAGAGTGKTTELTRVIRESIINGQCRPNAIIGTTFTIKAAGELVERVRQEFFKSGQVELGERLTESLLGTVDSVCLRLLTRFAFEAGISPDIQIIAETEAKALRGSAIEDSCSLLEIQTIERLGERLWQKERLRPELERPHRRDCRESTRKCHFSHATSGHGCAEQSGAVGLFLGAGTSRAPTRCGVSPSDPTALEKISVAPKIPPNNRRLHPVSA